MAPLIRPLVQQLHEDRLFMVVANQVKKKIPSPNFDLGTHKISFESCNLATDHAGLVTCRLCVDHFALIGRSAPHERAYSALCTAGSYL